MNTWYNLTYQGNASHVDIFGDIGSWNLTAEAFIAEIGREADKELVLNISSLGGAVNDALQIHDFLNSYPKKVTAKITGLTASSATIIAMAADEVLMSENALFLVHNVWTPQTSGNAEDLEKEAESLRQIDELLINIYKKKTKRRANTIANLMAEEKWLDAEEALRLGFIDKIYIPSKDIINSVVLNKIEKNQLPTLPINYINAIAEQVGEDEYTTSEEAEERAIQLGCSGHHTHEEGIYMPCESHSIYLETKNLFTMSLEKINEKVDLIINKIEGLFNAEGKEVEVLNKTEVEATLNAEIEELKNLYEFQIENFQDSLKNAEENLELKNAEIAELKNGFEENLKELNEKVEKLEAVETKAVKEEDAAIEVKAPETNPFDGIAEKMRF